jgi:hypothetical protein
MTAKMMTSTQQRRYIRICEEQGIRVTRTKKGLLLRFPDGSSTVQHFTQSDVKATQNQIARFRRAGMTHPDDPRPPVDLPSYITSGTITSTTRKKIIDYVIGAGFPEIVYQKDVTKALGMDPGWANRALYHTGFKAGKAKNAKIGRPWYTPQDILALEEQVATKPSPAEVASIVNGAKKAQEAINALGAGKPEHPPASEPIPTPEEVADAIEDGTASGLRIPFHVEAGNFEPEPENSPIGEPDPEVVKALEAIEDDENTVTTPLQKDGEREFIDSHDSWVVTPQELFGSKWETFMKDELRVLNALGLEFEIRVWRKQ